MLAPNHDAARYEYAIVLLKRHKHVRAREEMEKLLKTDPDNRGVPHHSRHGVHRLRRLWQALPLYREILAEIAPGRRTAPVDRACAEDAGQTRRPSSPIARPRRPALLRRGLLEPGEPEDLSLHRRRTRPDEGDEAAPRIRLVDRYHLCFALGKALEDRAEYAESFIYYERGNALKKTECRYKPEPLERNARLQAAVCTREFFAARAASAATPMRPFSSSACRARARP
jgi:tetratricopeptide (TPR) repeat protein